MSILIWILIGLLVYFVIVPFAFMELALNRPKKTEDGRLRIKKKGFVIRFFYGKNVLEEEKDKHFPKNTCQLYKGICGGIFCFCIIFPLCCLLLAFFLVLIYGVGGPFALILGYMPNPVGFLTKRYGHPFYPYEERSGNKKWIAPWKFILSFGMGVFLGFFYKEIFIGMIKVAHPLSSKTALIVYSIIAGLVFLIITINKIRKTESFAATKETVVSFVKKMCKEIEIT